jgi:type II secretory pathway pseudopilin PulG
VVSIVGVLAGLILPALSQAKGKGQRIKCINNVRQLVLTWQLYVTDNADALPLNGAGEPGSARLRGNRLWVSGNDHAYREAFENPRHLTDPAYALFADYLQSVEIYRCPSDRTRIPSLNQSPTGGAGGMVPRNRTYSMNGYVGYFGASEATSGYQTFEKLSQAATRSPSDLFLFADTNPQNVCYPAFVVRMEGDIIDGFFHYPASHHGGAGTLTFADGHSETRKWVDPRTRPELPELATLPHWNASPGNADLEWLRARATYRK